MKLPQSVMICRTISSVGVGPLCFIKTKVSAAVVPSAGKLYEDADFVFQQNLAPAHSAESTTLTML